MLVKSSTRFQEEIKFSVPQFHGHFIMLEAPCVNVPPLRGMKKCPHHVFSMSKREGGSRNLLVLYSIRIKILATTQLMIIKRVDRGASWWIVVYLMKVKLTSSRCQSVGDIAVASFSRECRLRSLAVHYAACNTCPTSPG